MGLPVDGGLICSGDRGARGGRADAPIGGPPGRGRRGSRTPDGGSSGGAWSR